MLKKLKTFINKYKKNLYKFISTNRQFFSFVLLLNIETSLLVILTIGIKSWNIKTLCFDFAVSVLLGSLGYIFKPKKQYAYFQTVLMIITCKITKIIYPIDICFFLNTIFTFLNPVNSNAI